MAKPLDKYAIKNKEKVVGFFFQTFFSAMFFSQCFVFNVFKMFFSEFFFQISEIYFAKFPKFIL